MPARLDEFKSQDTDTPSNSWAKLVLLYQKGELKLPIPLKK